LKKKKKIIKDNPRNSNTPFELKSFEDGTEIIGKVKLTGQTAPKEVLSLIFSFLEYGKSWKSVFCASKRWNEIGWETFDISLMCNWPLRWACYRGDTKYVRKLLKDDRVSPVSDKILQSPFEIACTFGHESIVSLLLKDPRVNPIENDNYAIKIAIKYDRRRIFEILREIPSFQELRIPIAKLPNVQFFRPIGNLHMLGWKGDISREEAENILKDKTEGIFLLRWSHNTYVISYKSKDKHVQHIAYIYPHDLLQIKIEKSTGKFSYYDSLRAYILKTQNAGFLSDPLID